MGFAEVFDVFNMPVKKSQKILVRVIKSSFEISKVK